MVVPQSVSTNSTRSKRGLGGRRLIIILIVLILLVVVSIWSENLSVSMNPENFASRDSKDISEHGNSKAGNDDEHLARLRTGLFERFIQRESSSTDDDWNVKKSKNKRKDRKASLRQKDTTKEIFQSLPTISTDDHIPMPAGGSVMHAFDALLCRDSVLDFVVNATDLRDECDGLIKAYTQTCDADEKQTSPASRRGRMLQVKANPVLYWQERLHQWSTYGKSLLRDSMTSQRFLKENDILDSQDYDDDDGGGDSSDGDYSRQEIASGARMNSTFKLLSSNFFDVTRRETKAKNAKQRKRKRKEAEEKQQTKSPKQVDEKEEDPSAAGKNPQPDAEKKEKKPLANLALPVMNKHLSEKTLTETLMLQQDNKIMKAVVNQTNITMSEAKADASVSSNAVAEAADMVSNILNDPTSVEARTCCTSILSVFHENCNANEEELSDRRLFVGVGVIAMCGLIKSLIRHFNVRWLPEAAGCILVGVVVGYILTFYPHNDMSFDGNWFLRIMVPPIVFEAALSIDKRSFSRHAVPIMFYAVLGTLIATGITAVVVHKGSQYLHCETIPYPEALTFGALISSIDPIAVLSVLGNMGMTDQDTIYVLIFGESLLNDGVAIVLYETLVHFLHEDMIVDSQAVTAAAIHFLVVFIGSLLIGLAYGLLGTLYYWVMQGCQTPLVEVLMFCCWALLPYYVCDGIEWSGIVAVVAAGFIMDMYIIGTEKLKDLPNEDTDSDPGNFKGRRPRSTVRRPVFSKEGLLSTEAKTHIAFVTEIIATMMETAIFAYLGLFLFSSRYHWNLNHAIIAISGCCIGRGIMISSLTSIANWITRTRQSRNMCNFDQLDPTSTRSNNAAGVVIDSKMQLVLWFAGLRGAMSFALVEHIPLYDAVTGEGTPFKSELKAMTSACIIFTVFFLGGGTFYAMEALGLAPKPKSDLSKEEKVEMTELLRSSSFESDDGGDTSDENLASDRDSSNNGSAVFRQTSTTNTQRRPIMRQRRNN